MLAHTHGQPASPTRLGKEFMVFVERLEKQLAQLDVVQVVISALLILCDSRLRFLDGRKAAEILPVRSLYNGRCTGYIRRFDVARVLAYRTAPACSAARFSWLCRLPFTTPTAERRTAWDIFFTFYTQHFASPLDISANMWYNISIQFGERI